MQIAVCLFGGLLHALGPHSRAAVGRHKTAKFGGNFDVNREPFPGHGHYYRRDMWIRTWRESSGTESDGARRTGGGAAGATGAAR